MLDDTFSELSDTSRPISHRGLQRLSGLSGQALAALRQAWPRIEVEHRRHLAHTMVEMAEDDVELDFSAVFRILLSDPDAEVRAAAIDGLWEDTDERLVEPLLSFLQSDPSPLVRAAAADSLGHFALVRCASVRRPAAVQRVRAALLATFRNRDDPLNTSQVRRNALESAALFTDDEQIAAAIRDAYADPDLALRAAALRAMGSTFNASWEGIIVAELDSPHPELRFEAARSAGELWSRRAVPRLVQLVADPDLDVCRMAVWALGQIGGKQAKAVLESLLHSPDETIREEAEEALEELRFGQETIEPPELPRARSITPKKR